MKTGNIEDGEVVLAVLLPVKRDDLRPGALPWLGKQLKWKAVGYIAEGPYKGDLLMQPWHNNENEEIGWFPASDLCDVVRVQAEPKQPLGGMRNALIG